MRRKRVRWKSIPQISPFEKGRAIEVGQLLKEGLNPLQVTLYSGLGGHHYTYVDVAHWYEKSHEPFSLTASLFKMVGDIHEGYVRTPAI